MHTPHSSLKLNQLRQDHRKEQIASMMTKIRYQTVQSHSKEELNTLINLPLESFTQQHLELLITHAEKDQTNAIILLGNLAIDRWLNAEYLEGKTWTLGNNQYWTWLINAFTEINYCTKDMMEYLIWRITIKKSNHNLENALEALQRCLKVNTQLTIECIQHREEFLLAVLNHIHDPNEKIFMLSLALIVTTTSLNEQFPRIFLKSAGEQRLTRCLQHGLMKLNTQARLYTVQAANNFAMSEVILPQIALRLIENAQSEKQIVKLQLSYFFLALAKQLPQSGLLSFITESELMTVLKHFSAQDKLSKHSKQIKNNAAIALLTITDRLQHLQQNLSVRQIYRWGMQDLMRDESEPITMCQEYNE